LKRESNIFGSFAMGLGSGLPRCVVDLIETLTGRESECIDPHACNNNANGREKNASKSTKKHEMNATP
jgi:hypothetical protein